ncbi:MAG: class I SAM-dependent methyltransferase, partial [Beijerinckiaceae bacterium]
MSPARRDTAVVYLARGAGGGAISARRFFESYRRYSAGAAHQLLVVMKGWDGVPEEAAVAAEAEALGARIVRTPDDGFDWAAYRRAAETTAAARIMFLNTHSEVLAPDWLRAMECALDRPGCGMAGATASWGGIEPAPHVLTAMITESGQAQPAPVLWARRIWRLGLHRVWLRLTDSNSLAPFPNPHLRSNAFLIERERFLAFMRRSGDPRTKRDAWLLESGPRGLTAELRKEQLASVVVGRNGGVFREDDWPASRTFRVPDTSNLLIADNQTRAYRDADATARRLLELAAWGETLTRDLPDAAQRRDGSDHVTKDCPCCGAASSVLVRAPDMNWKVSTDVFEVRRCEACDFRFTANPPADLTPYYTRNHYGRADIETVESVERASFGERYKLDIVTKHRSGGDLLEIGPSMGAFSKLAKDAGFTVSAIEMDDGCVDFLNQKLGVRAVCSINPASVLATEGRSYDVIAMWHSLEHMAAPWNVVEACARHLRPAGILVIAVPNPASRQAAWMGAGWPHYDLPRHLSHMTAEWLTAVAAKHGLERQLLTTDDEGSRSVTAQSIALWLLARTGANADAGGWRRALASLCWRSGRVLARLVSGR